MTDMWVVTREVRMLNNSVRLAYAIAWHLRDNAPHTTEYAEEWGTTMSGNSTFERMVRRNDEKTQVSLRVCSACLFSTQLSEGMARTRSDQ